MGMRIKMMRPLIMNISGLNDILNLLQFLKKSHITCTDCKMQVLTR